MKRKKWLWVAVSAVLVLWSFAGCGNNDAKEDGKTADAPEQEAAFAQVWQASLEEETEFDCDFADVTALPDGAGFFVKGTMAKSADADGEAFFAKYSGEGKQEWIKQVDNFWANSVAATKDGCLIAGTLMNQGEKKDDRDAMVLFTDFDGKELWRTVVRGSKADAFYSAKAGDGFFVLSGDTESTDGDFKGKTVVDHEGVIAVISAEGKLQSLNTYGGSGGEGVNMAIPTSDGGFAGVMWSSSTDGIVTGLQNAAPKADDASARASAEESVAAEGDEEAGTKSESADKKEEGTAGADEGSEDESAVEAEEAPADYNCVLFKTDADGKLQWSKKLAGTGSDYLYSLTESADGGLIASGFTDSTDGDFEKNTEKGAGFVCSMDGAGALRWVVYPGCSYVDNVIPSENGYFIAGTASDSNKKEIPLLAEIDENGKTLWQMDAPKEGIGGYFRVTPAENGAFVAAGWTSTGEGDWDKNASLLKLARKG